MWLSRFFVWFVLFSFMGWIFETIYTTIHERKWQDRGFLFGPIIPIYGVGAVAISAVLEFTQVHEMGPMTWYQVFLISFFGSMVLEYVTSWVLEKLFHAYWWDYHDMPFNINGRICLPASTLFGLAGCLVVFVLYPRMWYLSSGLTPIMMEAASLLLMAAVACDLTLTVSVLTNFDENVARVGDMVNAHMDRVVNNMDSKVVAASDKIQAERERVTKEMMEMTAANMPALHKAAMSRIKGLRPQKSSKRGEHSLMLFNTIRKTVHRRKKKDD